MKTYISILLIVLGLSAVVIGGYVYTKRQSLPPDSENVTVRMKTHSGSLTRFFEGENMVEYSFDIPEEATTTTEMEGALIKITTPESPYATMYISYEGGRGFTALDYINEIIAPHVSVINPSGVATIGNHLWQVAESEGSTWHIAPILDGQWLFIVENKKVQGVLVEKTLSSIVIK